VRVAQFKQNGHLYVASHYVGVFASLFGFRFKELIPISHIIEIKSDDDRRKLTVKFRSDKSAKHNQSEEKKTKGPSFQCCVENRTKRMHSTNKTLKFLCLEN
jgi:hypothetical protein